MSDISKITQAIGGLLSGNQEQQPLATTDIKELLVQAGIDPAVLDGLSQGEIFDLLQQHGIDPGQLDIGQISELLQNHNPGGNLAEMAQSWLSSRGGDGKT